MATLGTTWKNSICGVMKRSKRSEAVMPMASGMAIATASA